MRCRSSSITSAALALVLAATALADDAPRRVVVLGIDGMDHGLTRELLAAGELPNIARLADRGTFKPLHTTNPPLSPVAWSTFITGMNPGGHGIFDFLRRDPAKVRDGFLPEDAVTAVQTTSRRDAWNIPATDFVLPASERHVLLRHGVPFWELLEQRGIATVTYRMPASFPAEHERGRVIAGMGVPDVAGTYGSFTYLTTDPDQLPDDVAGGRVLHAVVDRGVVRVHESERNILPTLLGPENPFRASPSARQTSVDFEVYVDRNNQTGVVVLQGQTIVLDVGQWSHWLDVEFALLPAGASVRGLVRFYLQEASPELRLFATPIHPAPGTRGLASRDFDLKLARALGHFHTKGMPQETGAYTQGILSEDEYIAHSRLMHQEVLDALDLLLTEHERGLLFVYFCTLDLDSHVLWHHHDADHPGHDPDHAHSHERHIVELYKEMDRIVGHTLAALGPRDELYVISDHGFVSLHREFNLTTWLIDEGYLAHRPGIDPVQTSFFGGVDWQRTRAYGVGFNGLYINRQGREAHGPVPAEHADALIDEIRRKLLALEDAGQRVFEQVYRPVDLYTGDHVADAPDLILAYRPPFGPADDSVLGTPSPTIFADRLRGFTGHHTTDASFVPGVLLSTRRFAPATPRLEDVTATILAEFGASAPDQMTGRALRFRE